MPLRKIRLAAARRGPSRLPRRAPPFFPSVHGGSYGQNMTESKWLTRFLFLETVAGVPGMMGGMVRHLQSLRTMQRDRGASRRWIARGEQGEACLESWRKKGRDIARAREGNWLGGRATAVAAPSSDRRLDPHAPGGGGERADAPHDLPRAQEAWPRVPHHGPPRPGVREVAHRSPLRIHVPSRCHSRSASSNSSCRVGCPFLVRILLSAVCSATCTS